MGPEETTPTGMRCPKSHHVCPDDTVLVHRSGRGEGPVWTSGVGIVDEISFRVRFSRDPRSISLSGNPRTTPGSFPPNTGEDGESRLRAQFPGRTIPIVDGSTPEWTQAGSVEGGRGTVWMESLDVWWSQGVRPVVERRGGGVRSR